MPIRKATFDETQQILSHSLEVLKEATMSFVKPRRRKALEMMTPFLSDGGYYLVYVEEQKILGWVGVGRAIDYNNDTTVRIIPEIFVFPNYRKRGIAKKLCEEAFKYLKADGYQKIQLNVYSGNYAKDLYENLGFQEVSVLMEKQI